MGCLGVGAGARRRGRSREAEPVPGPSPSLEGFLEEEAFPRTFFLPRGRHSRGITWALFERGYLNPGLIL